MHTWYMRLYQVVFKNTHITGDQTINKKPITYLPE